MIAEQSNIAKYLIIALLKDSDESAPLHRTTIHKVLYTLRKELPKNSRVSQSIPFYWYCYGPFSDVVKNAISELLRTGILISYKTSKGKDAYRITREVDFHAADDLVDAAIRAENILKEIRQVGLKPFVRKLYESDAPYAFIPIFKLDFIDPIKDYNNSQKMISSSFSSLENKLYDSEANLPSEDFYEEFDSMFLTFVTGASRIFEYMSSYDNIEPLKYIYDAANKSIWNTFANGVRIIYHDSDYKEDLGSWNGIYNNLIERHGCKIDEFYNYSRNFIDSERVSKINSSSESGKILSSLINGYMS